MRPIDEAPRLPGKPINTDIGVVGWAQELEKTPPPFAWTKPDFVPEISREGGWRRMAWSDVLGWAYVTPMDIVHPASWEPITAITERNEVDA